MPGVFQFIIEIDQSLFRALNAVAGKTSVTDWLARLGADDHIIPVVLALLVLLVLLTARDRREREGAFECVICVFLAVVLAMVMLFVFNYTFFRPRPFTSNEVNMLFYNNTDSAMPSNAATLAFTMAFGVFLFKRRLGAVMIALAAYLGLARVVVGVHYPLDVIAGALLGLGCVLLVRAAAPLYRPLAGGLNRASDRLLASWSGAGGPGPGKGS